MTLKRIPVNKGIAKSKAKHDHFYCVFLLWLNHTYSPNCLKNAKIIQNFKNLQKKNFHILGHSDWNLSTNLTLYNNVEKNSNKQGNSKIQSKTQIIFIIMCHFYHHVSFLSCVKDHFYQNPKQNTFFLSCVLTLTESYSPNCLKNSRRLSRDTDPSFGKPLQ